jgi:RHH-type transcriptional regulator, proline utilization regulon repressor / proline dehydrogenase / delta 1-pyrroline-5-carboxylate dehydrogenase
MASSHAVPDIVQRSNPQRVSVHTADANDVEAWTVEIGSELLGRARQHRGGRFWSDQMLGWAMKDPAFKVQLFRFVDTFPVLKSSEQVYDCLVDYLQQPELTLPGWLEAGLKAGRLAKGVLAKTLAGRITSLAGTFIAGHDVASALPKLDRLWNEGQAFSLDLLGEACLSADEAEIYRGRYLDLITQLAERTRTWKASPVLESDYLGGIPRLNVSIKISSLSARVDAIDFEGSVNVLQQALRPILEAAHRHRVLVNFDMEQHALKDLTLELFRRCCEAVEFSAGLALQAYLRSAEEDAEQLIQWARSTGRQVTVRLIKGAYWDYEVMNAEQKGWPVPVWTDKRESDACFERLQEKFIAAMPRRADDGGVKLALGTHNVRSIAHGLALLRKHALPPSALEVQTLYGMADQLRAAVSGYGLRVRQYVPLGELIPGMGYFVRRLLENTSNQSWLRAGFYEHASDEQLLASPHPPASGETAVEPELAPRTAAAASLARLADRQQLSPAVEGLGQGRPFVNEPPRNFARREQREHFAAAVRAAVVPQVLDEVTPARATEAVDRAVAGFPAWHGTPPLQRAAILLAAAERLRRQRDTLSGVIVREAGKPWREADADVCEAIDFWEYYARWAVSLFQPARLGRFVAEWNEVWHQPRGVAVVISPWNFPLAICAGMTGAALVTGNPVVVKPASPTRGIARAMCDVLWQAGVPADALQFVPGSGETGAALVRDPRVALIAFTGSLQVGLDILQAAAAMPEAQDHVKKVVCEMGGKNAIIVDDSADMDEAVLGVRQSAFGYSGQKCSACSRVIVVADVYEVFLRRLVNATRSLIIGDPLDPGTDIGPLINAGAAEKVRRYIERGQQEGTLELACAVPPGLEQRVGKPFVGPHIFSGIQPQHRLAQEEIFGPVLAVMQVRDFDQALAWANATRYRLTGGVFSRRPSHLQRARRELHVGNLYLNRGITGALVGRQPFGGFGHSGTGTQAGGPEYLLHFVEPRSACENTLRHGFAPGLD